MSDDELILLATRGTFRVHRYRRGVAHIRLQVERLVRDGRLRFVCCDRCVLHYRAAK